MKIYQYELGCQCALSATCMTFDRPTLCNCDSRGFNLTDEGTLSSDQLPIYGLSYGGSFTPYSSLKVKIGPLICSGKKGSYPSEAENFEKEKLKRKLLQLTNQIAETKKDLDKLVDQSDEIKRQNLN